MTTDKQQSSARLGFIGMGAMGSRMAGRLLAAGYDLTVYNRKRERVRPLEQRGAKVAPTPGDLAGGADIVLFSGGEETVYIRCRPILGVLGRESCYLGPCGSGATMKLCVNTLLGLGM